ncbi:MAG: hypothetical protein WDA09_01410 [Bacteriovoracaceae bacterium]
MKAKILLFLIILFIPFICFASSTDEFRDLFDSTYSRDNSFCQYNNARFELQIRSLDRYSQPNDRDYGEYPFIVQKGIRYKMNFKGDIGRYRMIYAKEEECSKSLAIPLNKEEITLFYAQDHRPFPDLLVLVRYNTQKNSARVIHTNLPIQDYYQIKDKLLFSSYVSKTNISTTDFDGATYTHMKSSLPLWKMYYQGKINNDPQSTFNQFEWNHYFKNLDEFKDHFEWDKSRMVFKKDSFELIFNYDLKKRCLRVKDEWRCKAI